MFLVVSLMFSAAFRNPGEDGPAEGALQQIPESDAGTETETSPQESPGQEGERGEPSRSNQQPRYAKSKTRGAAEGNTE